MLFEMVQGLEQLTRLMLTVIIFMVIVYRSSNHYCLFNDFFAVGSHFLSCKRSLTDAD